MSPIYCTKTYVALSFDSVTRTEGRVAELCGEECLMILTRGAGTIVMDLSVKVNGVCCVRRGSPAFRPTALDTTTSVFFFWNPLYCSASVVQYHT